MCLPIRFGPLGSTLSPFHLYLLGTLQRTIFEKVLTGTDISAQISVRLRGGFGFGFGGGTEIFLWSVVFPRNWRTSEVCTFENWTSWLRPKKSGSFRLVVTSQKSETFLPQKCGSTFKLWHPNWRHMLYSWTFVFKAICPFLQLHLRVRV